MCANGACKMRFNAIYTVLYAFYIFFLKISSSIINPSNLSSSEKIAPEYF